MLKKKKSPKITFIITTLILIIMSIYIRLTGFLKFVVPKLIFYINRKILNKLDIVEHFYIILIFSKYISLG